MKKTKIVKTGSIRRFALALCSVVLLVTSFLAMFPAPHASAAVASATDADARAKAYCEGAKHYSKDTSGGLGAFTQISGAAACERGYNSSIQGQQVDYNTICNAQDIVGINPYPQSACEAGFKQGQKEFNKDNSKTPTAAEAASKAKTYCTDLQKNQADITACEKGYQAAILGEQTDPASTCTGSNKDACTSGFLQGLREYQLNNSIANPSSPNNNNGGTSSTSDKQLECEFLTTNPLNWIICPIVKTMVASMGAFDGLINNFLKVDTGRIFDNSSADKNNPSHAYYAAWQSFRNIALGLMVIAGLVIVISQAIGAEILDAYAVRKTLPRILIAALAISLSWPLMQFAVNLSNDLGVGIRHLIYQPFSDLPDKLDLSLGGSVLNLFFGGVAAGGVALAAIPAWTLLGGLGTLMSLVGTAGLAILLAVLVLILRQIAITMLIILAPIAIVAYIFPNTQRVYKLWWESFSKALLMFPLIAGFIAAGRVFSAVAVNTGGPIYQLVGFAAYFAPYFMIPFTFKFAGGALSGISGAISNRARAGFGALSNYRSGQRKDRLNQARNGGLFRKNFIPFNRPFKRDEHGNRVKTSVGRAFNKLNDYTLDADEIVPIKLGTTTLGGRKKKPGIPGFRRGAERDLGKIEHSAHEQSVKAFQEVNPGYKGGRLLGGLITGAEHDYLSGLSAADQKHVVEKFAAGVDEHGNITWKDGNDYTYGDRKELATIMSRSNDLEAREAGQEFSAAIPAFERFPQSADTARVSASMVGMLAAAQAGRLGVDDLVTHHNHMLQHGVSESEALHHTTQLQDVMAPKRVSAARGHAIAYRKDGTAYNVYNTDYDAETGTDRGIEHAVFSEKAGNSLARISTPEMAQIKSEDLDGAVGETWVAQGTAHQASWGVVDPATGQMGVVVDKSSLKTDPQAADRAREIQNRFKYLASYSQGDSDVGRKLRALWVRMGREATELDFGTRDHHEVIAGGAAAPPPPGTPGPTTPPAPGGI